MTGTAEPHGTVVDSAGGDELLTMAELCFWLKVKRATIYDYTYQRRIPFCRVGRSLRFPRQWIEWWLRFPEVALKSFFDKQGGSDHEHKEARTRQVSGRHNLDRRRKAFPPPPPGLRFAKGCA
jgi:excisionase family DNA binding protein